MIFLYCLAVAAYLSLISFFLLLYFGLYRPLYSHPYPGELADVISAVSNVRLVELERLVSEEMSARIAETLSPREQRLAKRNRSRAISDRLAPIEANASLCVAFARPQVRLLRRTRQGPKACRMRSRSERDRLLEELFKLAQDCCLLLIFAKAIRIFMPWDRERMIRFHRETVLPEVRDFLLVFLQYAATFGDYQRENLLAWLDCWELDEGYC
ncbi:MAG TPA: hypothetical protein VNY51_09305 [Candidatus Dormibacteraeota bacterium]|jgi:hypothetical protein|nr:hypothetical protein [Candidatus Dormibacteraeota bacterium]